MKPLLFGNFVGTENSAKNLFSVRFQRSLRECLRHGFLLEESFGLVWEETLDDVCLTEAEQSEVYGELLAWARGLPNRKNSTFFPEIIHQPAPKTQQNP